jgi:curli production assembly/transport component CsgG/holdfast attachment protein HfaB
MTKTRLFAIAKAPAAVLLASSMLTACVSPIAGPGGRYAMPDRQRAGDVQPHALFQGAGVPGRLGPPARFGRAPDRGRPHRRLHRQGEADGSGRKITQGASLMAISALAKSGARLVERYDTSVSELELKYANNKLIGDEVAATSARSTRARSPAPTSTSSAASPS